MYIIQAYIKIYQGNVGERRISYLDLKYLVCNIDLLYCTTCNKHSNLLSNYRITNELFMVLSKMYKIYHKFGVAVSRCAIYDMYQFLYIYSTLRWGGNNFECLLKRMFLILQYLSLFSLVKVG